MNLYGIGHLLELAVEVFYCFDVCSVEVVKLSVRHRIVQQLSPQSVALGLENLRILDLLRVSQRLFVQMGQNLVLLDPQQRFHGLDLAGHRLNFGFVLLLLINFAQGIKDVVVALDVVSVQMHQLRKDLEYGRRLRLVHRADRIAHHIEALDLLARLQLQEFVQITELVIG